MHHPQRRASAPILWLCMAGAAGPAAAQPETYRLDPEHSFVHFAVEHFGTSTLRGRFGPVQGVVTIDRTAGSGDLGLRIATASVSTGLAVLDARLRQPDLLASSAYPEAYFVARQFRFDGDALAEVRGEFTLRGVSQPLSLIARRFACRTDARPDGAPPRRVCGGDFEAELLRSSVGATFGLPFVGDRVQLQIDVEGVRE